MIFNGWDYYVSFLVPTMPDQSMFADPLHMTYAASKDFSRRLGESLRGDRQVSLLR